MNALKLIRYFGRGAKDSVLLGLSEEKNWTPIFVYIHVSRLLLGVFLGFVLGISVTMTIFFYMYHTTF